MNNRPNSRRPADCPRRSLRSKAYGLKSIPGFTLIEILVVITIIGILMGLLFPAIKGAIQKAKENRARTEIKNIEVAIKQYYTDYGLYPVVPLDKNGNSADYNFSSWTGYANNAQLMDILRSIDSTTAPSNAGNQNYVNNKKRIVYLEVSGKSIDANRNMIDPWGNPYEITIDTGLDNDCKNMPVFGTVSNVTVTVWSRGKDGNPVPPAAGATGDEIKSWQ